MYRIDYELNMYYEFSREYASIENLHEIMNRDVLQFAKENKVQHGNSFIFAEIFKDGESMDSVSYFAEIAKGYSKIESDTFS